MQLDINDITMRYKSRIEAESVMIRASNVHIEGEAEIQTSGRGPGPEEGDSPGGRVDGVGTGAGHGGFGGGADLLDYAIGMA